MVCVCPDGDECRIGVTHYVCCRVGEFEENRSGFNHSLSIACFSSGHLCRLGDHRRLVEEPGNVECRLICLGGMIDT